MIGSRPPTFHTVTVPVFEGVARIPDGYAHDFASIPVAWRTVQTGSKYVVFPALDPASERAVFGASAVHSCASDEFCDCWDDD